MKDGRPCGGCGRVQPGGAYTPDQCRICYLYATDPAFKALWDGIPAPLPPRGPCVHLGKVLDRRGKWCHRCWVHACPLHGRCVQDDATAAGVRRCASCPDHEGV